MHCLGCKCSHHFIAKIFVLLIWLSAFGFWWFSWKGGQIWWMDAEHFFKDVVIFGFLVFSMKFCNCCEMGKMMGGNTCKHAMDCKCGDCDRCK